MTSIEKIPTYVHDLDEALGGGIPEGSVVLISGSPGTMKTSLAFSILYNNSRHGRKGLYITLEESGEDLRRAMEGMGMRDFHESELYLLDMGTLRLELSESETEVEWLQIFEGVVREALKVSSYRLIALDSLESLYTTRSPENPRQYLFELFSFLKESGVTVLVVSEVPFGSQTFAAHGVDFLADGIILLRQYENMDFEFELRLRCVKMRKVKHDRGDLILELRDGRFSVRKPRGLVLSGPAPAV